MYHMFVTMGSKRYIVVFVVVYSLRFTFVMNVPKLKLTANTST